MCDYIILSQKTLLFAPLFPPVSTDMSELTHGLIPYVKLPAVVMDLWEMMLDKYHSNPDI